MASCTDRRALRATITAPLARCVLLVSLGWTQAGAAADVVLTNTPNGTPGGSPLDADTFKSLIFTTNRAGGLMTAVTLGLNPAQGSVPPVTQNVSIALWSVSVAGNRYTPLARITGTALQPVNISATGNLYSFSNLEVDRLFKLAPNTTYGLTLSSDATGIRWSNTGTTALGTATSPTALAGYTFRGFRATDDAGLSWQTTEAIFNTVVLSVDARILAGNLAYASNPYDTGFNGGTLLVDAPGTYATAYHTGTGGSIDGNGLASVFSGAFSGAGDLAFTNSGQGGSITLSGQHTYTGATRVGANATLVVNGSIASSSSLAVSAGGTVQGNGRLPQTNLVAGATLAPGNSIGSLSAAGLSLNGGTLVAEFQGPRSDRLNVSGQVSHFTGTARLASYGGGSPWPYFHYTLLTAPNSAGFASARSLTLDTANVGSALLRAGASLKQEVDGDASTFDLQWQTRAGKGVATAAARALGADNANQLANAGALDRVFRALVSVADGNARASGTAIGNAGFTTAQAAAAGIAPGFLDATSQLLGLQTDEQLVAGLSALSPESWAAFQSAGLDTLKRQREALLGKAGACATGGGVLQSAENGASTPPLCVFAEATNASSEISGRGGLADYDTNLLLSSFGLEYQPAADWTVGAAFSHGSLDLDHMTFSRARIGADVNGISGYGVYRPTAAWTFRGLVAYSNFDAQGSRQVAFIDAGGALGASPGADGYTVAFNGDYLLVLSDPKAPVPLFLKPQVGLAWGGYEQAGFQEMGTSGLGMRVDGNLAQSLVASVGFELSSAPLALDANKTRVLTPRLALAYQVDALGEETDQRSLHARWSDSPGAGAVEVLGEHRGMHGFKLDGGAELKLARNAALYANLGYEAFSTGAQFNCGGGLKLTF